MSNKTINEIIKKSPETIDIFKRYRIDTNIGGYDTLEEASMILGLNVKEIEKEIKEAVA